MLCIFVITQVTDNLDSTIRQTKMYRSKIIAWMADTTKMPWMEDPDKNARLTEITVAGTWGGASSSWFQARELWKFCSCRLIAMSHRLFVIVFVFFSLSRLRSSGGSGSLWGGLRSILLEPDSMITRVHANRFMSLEKECQLGCEKIGNCNMELGQCECPWPKRGVMISTISDSKQRWWRTQNAHNDNDGTCPRLTEYLCPAVQHPESCSQHT